MYKFGAGHCLSHHQWPYSYDACDVGTAPNQTIDDKPSDAEGLSYLPGQRLSRCTCDGEDHPGPKHSDGSYVGRSAPEIDVFEAQIENDAGAVSQSAQWAVSLYVCTFVLTLTVASPI